MLCVIHNKSGQWLYTQPAIILTCGCAKIYCPTGPTGATGPPGPQGEPGPFLSSYLEAVGSTQEIIFDGDVLFDTDPTILDVAGSDIELDANGTTFNILSPGLYHVEWCLNLGDALPPVLMGLLENGNLTSALSHTGSNGNYSSGALIALTAADVPYTLSLHNLGGPVTLENPVGLENTAASIRILRFADGPN